MRTRYKKGGYSSQTANEYIDIKQPIHSLSTELEKQFRFEDGKPTKDGEPTATPRSRRKGSVVVKAVTIPAWQFFRLIRKSLAFFDF